MTDLIIKRGRPVTVSKESILAAALELAREHGYTNVTRDAVAARVGCTPSLIPHHFGTMVKFRRAIMGEALRTRCPVVVAQGLTAKDTRALSADEELKRRAVESLMC